MSEFDPAKYLTKVGKADYLEVKFRLLWLREVHPDAQITTELIAHDPQRQWAMFRAYVSIPGGGAASGHGSEDVQGFREYIEKAETKAIGRALGALGFGTQFADDFDMGEKLVDSPVHREPANLPPRGRTTSENTVPVSNGAPDSWTQFWAEARRAGLQNWNDIEAALGVSKDQFRHGGEALDALHAKMQAAAV